MTVITVTVWYHDSVYRDSVGIMTVITVTV